MDLRPTNITKSRCTVISQNTSPKSSTISQWTAHKRRHNIIQPTTPPTVLSHLYDLFDRLSLRFDWPHSSISRRLPGQDGKHRFFMVRRKSMAEMCLLVVKPNPHISQTQYIWLCLKIHLIEPIWVPLFTPSCSSCTGQGLHSSLVRTTLRTHFHVFDIKIDIFGVSVYVWMRSQSAMWSKIYKYKFDVFGKWIFEIFQWEIGIWRRIDVYIEDNFLLWPNPKGQSFVVKLEMGWNCSDSKLESVKWWS